MVVSSSLMPSSMMKCFRHALMMLDWREAPGGPKSYNPATPFNYVGPYSATSYTAIRTSVDLESWGIEESAIEKSL